MSDLSPARRDQLERLKHKRRSARDSRRYVEQEGQPASVAAITYAQLLAEIRRISMGQVAPSQARFDYAKPTTWATADEQCRRFGMTWGELVAEAGGA